MKESTSQPASTPTSPQPRYGTIPPTTKPHSAPGATCSTSCSAWAEAQSSSPAAPPTAPAPSPQSSTSAASRRFRCPTTACWAGGSEGGGEFIGQKDARRAIHPSRTVSAVSVCDVENSCTGEENWYNDCMYYEKNKGISK